MNLVEKKIYKMRPGFVPRFESMIRQYSQYGGGAKDDKYIGGRGFSNVYEFLHVCFFHWAIY